MDAWANPAEKRGAMIKAEMMVLIGLVKKWLLLTLDCFAGDGKVRIPRKFGFRVATDKLLATMLPNPHPPK